MRAAEASADEVRAYLEGEEKSVLVSLLLERAASDRELYERLVLRAATAKGQSEDGVELPALKEALDRALGTGGYLGYREERHTQVLE